MKTINLEKPKYGIGDIIDISYIHGGLPNRILITKVWADENSGGWMYDVKLESTGDTTQMQESFIEKREIDKSHDVYDLTVIKKRYAKGFRYAGNAYANNAETKAREIAKSPNIERVVIREAYDGYGNFKPNMLAIWIRYLNPINFPNATDPTPGSKSYEKWIK